MFCESLSFSGYVQCESMVMCVSDCWRRYFAFHTFAFNRRYLFRCPQVKVHDLFTLKLLSLGDCKNVLYRGGPRLCWSCDTGTISGTGRSRNFLLASLWTLTQSKVGLELRLN